MPIGSIVESLVRWIEPVFSSAGYYLIVGAVLLERSVFVGLVVPGDVILALGGVYASRGELSLVAVIVLGIVAAVIGESVGFWLGRRVGRALFRRLPILRRLDEKFEDAEDFFRRHGGKTVAIGRFATVVGAFIPFTAGAARMRYARFLAFDIPAIAVWATAIALIGYQFGANLALVDKIVSRFGYIMLGLVVAVVAARFIWKRRQERRGDRR